MPMLRNWERDQDFTSWLDRELYTQTGHTAGMFDDNTMNLMYSAFCAGRRSGEQGERSRWQHFNDDSLDDI